jgi:NitT/TauT family transport system substrate-binding protein
MELSDVILINLEGGTKMKSKKMIYCLSMFFFLLSSVPVFAQDVVTDEKTKITIGYAPFGMLETSVAKVKQFYKKYLPNVDVEWFFGLYSPHLVNNWIAGKLEISYLGDMPAIMLQDKARNTRWVSNGVSPRGQVLAIFVNNNSKVQSLKDLEGKSIATGVGSAQHRMIEVIGAKEGIKFDIVNQAPEVALGNLEAGKVEAFGYWPPYIEMVKYKKVGRAIMADACKYEPEVNAVWPLLVSEAFNKKNPKIVEGLVRADLDLHKYVQANLDEASQIVFKELEEKIPLPVIKASLASYRYGDKIDKEEIETVRRGIDFMKSKGYIKTGFDPADWADTSYVNKILSGKK